MEEEKEIDSKEISDALHMLLHCSYKDTEYETQKEQFEIVNVYIKQLEEENRTLKRVNNMTEDISIEDITQVMDKSYKDFMKEFFPKSKIKEKIDKTKFYIPEYQGEFVAIEDLENVLEEE